MIAALFIARPWLKWALPAVLALLIVGGALWWLSARDETNQTIGATVEREKAATVTIQNVEKANDARDEIRDPASRAGYEQCMHSARTRANCQRFLPDR